jgi:opacity protein-like surface antigen
MNIKSLLLGSAAALLAVSGARAADVVVAEPEPVEYVRVCDAYGTGFFYIPGTETCLKISGYVRYDIDVAEFSDGEYGWVKNARGQLEIDAREETEWGTLRGFFALQGNSNVNYIGWADADDDGVVDLGELGANRGNVVLDTAFIEIGTGNVLHIGYSDNAFDGGIVSEVDDLGGAKVNRIAYTFSGGSFDATISIDDDNDDDDGIDVDFVPNVSANVGGTFGAVSARLFGAYDNITDEGAVKLRLGADVTTSTKVEIAGVWASGPTYVWDASEWSIAAGIAHTFSPAVKLEVGGQYWNDRNFGGAGSPDRWQIGANLDYTPTKNLLIRAQAIYFDDELTSSDGVTGKLRFQRSF